MTETTRPTRLVSALKVIIDVALGLALFVSFVGIVIFVIRTFVPPGRPSVVDLPFDVVPRGTVPALDQLPGVSNVKVAAKLRLEAPDRPFLLVALAPLVFRFVFAVPILLLLRKIFEGLLLRAPFGPALARRLRLLGGFVLLGELGSRFVDHASGVFLQTYLRSWGTTFRSGGRVDLGAVFLGLVLFVIADVARTGARLQEEQELTV
jgi:hypothetical protein